MCLSSGIRSGIWLLRNPQLCGGKEIKTALKHSKTLKCNVVVTEGNFEVCLQFNIPSPNVNKKQKFMFLLKGVLSV